MTLTEVLPTIRQLSTIEKLKLIRILAEDLEAAEDISPLEPFKTYDLPTPYNSFGAGAVLMQAAKGSKTGLIIMRFRYSTWDPSQNEFDRLPRVPIILRREGHTVEALGLVDSGATINVMPYELGLQLGATWDDSRAIIQLAGNLGNQAATPFFAMVQVGDIAPIQLAFAWTKSPNTPLILGQANFFMEFDVCFYRSKMEFEVKPKSP